MQYDRDDSGRRPPRRVTADGGFDTAVQRLTATCDTHARADLVSSCDSATVGSGASW
ncbi:MAG: hypothetical protein KJZ69_00015 [Phycisphaerales bacterium]|nr:hypothetical protein [Phycisphaerales bacterium]